MVRKALFTLVVALVAAPWAAASPPPAAPGPPAHRLPVPADVLAAHPGGFALPAVAAVVGTTPAPIRSTAARRDGERITCWRAYFTGDNSGWFGTEQETINPYWCGNGSVLRGEDSSWHYQSCTLLVSCNGESGPFGWIGCTYGCSSYGGEIIGRFTVNLFTGAHVDLTVLFEVYGDGGYWGYVYHD
jgi:hypothetical protein